MTAKFTKEEIKQAKEMSMKELTEYLVKKGTLKR